MQTSRKSDELPPDYFDEYFAETRAYLVSVLGGYGEELYASGMEYSTPIRRARHYSKLLKAIKEGSLELLANQNPYKYPPVDIETFLLEPYYLNLSGQVYPVILEELKKINSGMYVESVFTGAIGTAKTTMALWTTAYQLYLLSCMKNPQITFGIARTDEILLIFQSLNKSLAEDLDYARFRALVEDSQYFKDYFPFKKDIESKLIFPNRIIVKPVSGADTAAIGQNVMGGIIDELNYMAVIENSKASIDGGTYDQAVALYNSIARRRKSRFMAQGKLPGILCLVSSKRYPGQFTDIKEEEAKTDSTIYVYDKRVWDIKPNSFVGEWFKVFLGNEFENPFIIEDGDDTSRLDQSLIMAIPVEYRSEFETDITNAVREIAGYSTLSKHPFIQNAGSITRNMGTRESILSAQMTDFDKYPLSIDVDLLKDKEEPRYIHVDLSISGDSTGVACGYISKFVEIDNGEDVEVLPQIEIDFTLEVRPPKGGEIQFHKIRKLIYTLRSLGVNVKWVSFDSFQSKDSMQILAQRGYMAGTVSMDTSSIPYQFLKGAFYTDRISLPEHDKLRRELMSLEYDPKKGKVDHPSTSSKDISDALAGVAYGLTTRRELWSKHRVPVTQVPRAITDALSKQKQE